MRFVEAFSLHNGGAEWQRRELYDWLTDLFQAPQIKIAPGCTSQIRAYLKDELANAGWSYNVRIHQDADLAVTSTYKDVAFQIQTGNISRAIYDLVKLQYLYTQEKIETAALAIPTKTAADTIGSNVAHAERIWGEVQLFDRIITFPLLLVSFE